jgi:CO dehydrogenase maturation factor
MDDCKPLRGRRLGIVGKGGSGKSTLTVLLARALRTRGYEVCVLDADSTNVGLHQALGLAEPPRGLIDYFGGMVFSGGLVTCPVDDPTPLAGAEVSPARLPAEYVGSDPDGVSLIVAGKVAGRGPGAGCDGPIAKIARDLRVLGEPEEPVTLIDYKAGFEDAARGVVTSLDWALAVVDPTAAGIQVALHLKDLVERLKAEEPPATSHLGSPELVALARRIFKEASIRDVLVVLNRFPDRETEAFVTPRLADAGIVPVGVVHEHPELARSSLLGAPLDWTVARDEALGIVERLEAIRRPESTSRRSTHLWG